MTQTERMTHLLNNIQLWDYSTMRPVPTDLWGFNCFPDGQIQAWIDNKLEDNITLSIRARLVSADVVLGFSFLAEVLYWTRKFPDSVLYWYGARCDKFEAGNRVVTNVSKSITDIVSGSDKIIVFYPHSPIVNTTGEVFPVVSPFVFPLNKLPQYFDLAFDWNSYDGIIFPDGSARGRFEDNLKEAGITLPTYECVKVRDQVTSDIIKHEIPDLPEFGNFLIMDDICDGGRTFIDIVINTKVNLSVGFDLFVPHGVFSNNALQKLLNAGIGKVFTTDSYQDFDASSLTLPYGFLNVYKIFKQDLTNPTSNQENN